MANPTLADLATLAAEVVRLDGAATPGPWHSGKPGWSDEDRILTNITDGAGSFEAVIAEEVDHAEDRTLIAAYRTACPTLAAAWSALAPALAAWLAAVEAVEAAHEAVKSTEGDDDVATFTRRYRAAIDASARLTAASQALRAAAAGMVVS